MEPSQNTHYSKLKCVMPTRSKTTESLHKKRTFPLRISSGKVSKSVGICDLITFTGEILNGKLYLLCSGSLENTEFVKRVVQKLYERLLCFLLIMFIHVLLTWIPTKGYLVQVFNVILTPLLRTHKSL